MSAIDFNDVTAIRELLRHLGWTGPDFDGTPERVSRMYIELFNKPQDWDKAIIESDVRDMIALIGHSFWTMCPHHLLPVQITAHVAYIPDGRIIGLSKLARLVESFSTRPRLQEDITHEAADALFWHQDIDPRGVMVVTEAQHGCMICRGIRTTGSVVVSAARGVFLDEHKKAREEFLSLISHA
jgi:GTP cyclohydrolase I